MLDQHSRETNEISDILFAMDQNFQEREREAKSDFQSLVDEIRNKVIISSSFKDIQFESFNGIKIGFCFSRVTVLICITNVFPYYHCFL